MDLPVVNDYYGDGVEHVEEDNELMLSPSDDTPHGDEQDTETTRIGIADESGDDSMDEVEHVTLTPSQDSPSDEETPQSQPEPERHDMLLPCPPLCGASWGPHGQLIYFSNFPVLTHYLVRDAAHKNRSHNRDHSHTHGDEDVFEHEPHDEQHQDDLSPQIPRTLADLKHIHILSDHLYGSSIESHGDVDIEEEPHRTAWMDEGEGEGDGIDETDVTTVDLDSVVMGTKKHGRERGALASSYQRMRGDEDEDGDSSDGTGDEFFASFYHAPVNSGQPSRSLTRSQTTTTSSETTSTHINRSHLREKRRKDRDSQPQPSSDPPPPADEPPTDTPVSQNSLINTSILITDLSSIIPCDIYLAHHYHLSGTSASEICLANRDLCTNRGREDLAQTWHMAAMVTHPEILASNNPFFPWSQNPFGGGLANKLIEQHLRLHDLQTVALLSCVFSFPSSHGALFPARSHHHNTPASPLLPPSSSSSSLVYLRPPSLTLPSLLKLAPPRTSRPPIPQPNTLLHTMSVMNANARASISSPSPSPSPSTPGASITPTSNISSTSQPQSGRRLETRPTIPTPTSALTSPTNGTKQTLGLKAQSETNLVGLDASIPPPLLQPPQRYTSALSAQLTTSPLFAGLRKKSSDSLSSLPIPILPSPRDDLLAPADDDKIPVGTQLIRAQTQPENEVYTHPHGHTAHPHPHLLHHDSLDPEGMDGYSATSDDDDHSFSTSAAWSLSLTSSDIYRLLYADYLYRIGALRSRASILKFIRSRTALSESLTGYHPWDYQVGLDPICATCGHTNLLPSSSNGNTSNNQIKSRHKGPNNTVRCYHCNSYTMRCALCQIAVKGLASICIWCRHGGHPTHMRDWFTNNTECPSGCGCACQHQQQSLVIQE